MRWQCTIQDGGLWLANDAETIAVDLVWRMGSPDRH
jgi:uncharacterized protein YaeQ